MFMSLLIDDYIGYSVVISPHQLQLFCGNRHSPSQQLADSVCRLYSSFEYQHSTFCTSP